MNWKALGAVVETIGALGVIATLAYLAVQRMAERSRELIEEMQSLSPGFSERARLRLSSSTRREA